MSIGGGSSPEARRRPRPGGRRPSRWPVALICTLATLLGARAGRGAEPAPPVGGRGAGGSDAFVNMLLDLGLPAEAGLEARRVTFENGPDAIAPQTAFQLGMALALDYRAEEAVPFLSAAAAATDDPVRADQWQLATGVVLLRTKAFPHAEHVFSRVEAFGADGATRAFATRLRCIAEVLAHDGAAARACVRELPATDAPRAAEVDDLLSDLELDARLRGWVGGALSAVVPGLGQATGGHPGDGLLALAVNGGFGAGVYLLIADGAVADASLLGLGLGLRYYLGNIHNGAEVWRGAAERRRAAAAERLIRLLGPAP